MTTDLDSGLGGGTNGTPNPPPSASEGDKPVSDAATITKAEFEALFRKVSQLESLTRSDKDRAVKRTNERLDKLEGDLRPVLERALELARSGKTTEEALNIANSEQEDALSRKTLVEMAKAWKEGKLFAPPSGSGTGLNDDVAEVIAKAKLDPADPRVVSILREHGGDLTAIALELGKLAAREKPAPDVSAAPPMQAGAPSASDEDSLRREYDKKVKLLRGNPSAIAELKQEYRRKGLAIW